jgi:activator of 2-hydroxyglutaryl-CoA dehydratase
VNVERSKEAARTTSYVGVNIGALTVKVVALKSDETIYHGILLLGPFNCLALRISEAILKPLCYRLSMPILTYESDGYAVPPVFLRQVEVHIQQVLDAFEASGRARSARSEPPVVEAGDAFTQRIEV